MGSATFSNLILVSDNVRVSKPWGELNVVVASCRCAPAQRAAGAGGRCPRGASCFLAQRAIMQCPTNLYDDSH